MHKFHDPKLAEMAALADILGATMMATGSTSQSAPAQEAGRPQPQTTVEPAGGPFIRHSQAGRAPIYSVAGGIFGGILTQPLVARPGYFRNLRITHTFVTTGAVTAGVLTPDAPFNSSALTQMKDAFGTPLIVAPGYEAARIINVFSGGFGLDNFTNLGENLPSNAVLSNTTGVGQFSYAIPLEFAKAYGVLSAANASLLPTLQFNFASATTVFGAGSSGAYPTINTQIDTDFYWLPEGVAVEPPGLGTTRQWILQQANPTLQANAAARLQFPRLGGYLDTLILEVRDNTGARNGTYWPVRLQIYVDGVPMIDSTINEVFDDMAISYGLTPAQIGWASAGAGALPGPITPTFALQNLGGIVAFNRKTSLNQKSLGLLDTGESFLSSNPGTLIEANFAPVGAGTNSPAILNIMVGQVVPTGAIIQGLPEV